MNTRGIDRRYPEAYITHVYLCTLVSSGERQLLISIAAILTLLKLSTASGFYCYIYRDNGGTTSHKSGIIGPSQQKNILLILIS